MITDQHLPVPHEEPVPFVKHNHFQADLIRDVNHGRKHGRTWGDCVHSTMRVRSVGHFTTAFYGGGVKRFDGQAHVQSEEGTLGGSATGPVFDLMVNSQPPGLFDYVAGKADQLVDSMTTQIHEQFNLAVDIWESPDLLKIIPEFHHIVQLLGDLVLSWNFAVKPTVQDLQLLVGPAFRATRERIKFLRKNNGKVVKSTRTGNYLDFDISQIPSIVREDEDMRNGLRVEYRPYSASCVFRLTAWAQINLSGLDDFGHLVDAYAASFGLLNPVKTVWEHVPFSFVVEWFLNLKGFLDSMGGKPFDGSIDIVDSQVSSRLSILWDMYQHRDLEQDPPRLDPYYTGTSHLTSVYRRTKGLPMAGLLSGSLSPLQELLLGAMLRQRIPHL